MKSINKFFLFVCLSLSMTLSPVANAYITPIFGGGGGGGGAVDSVNGQTGVVVLGASDVGLGNVNNTSDATKNAASATLTNKTINGPDNTITNLSASSITSGLLGPALGGTGVANNAAATLTRSGNHALTLTTTGVTNVTLPTTGTLRAGTITAAQGGTGQTSYTKGDLLVATGSAAVTKVGVGSNNKVLVADSAETSGVKWGDAPLSTLALAPYVGGLDHWGANYKALGNAEGTVLSHTDPRYVQSTRNGNQAVYLPEANAGAELGAVWYFAKNQGAGVLDIYAGDGSDRLIDSIGLGGYSVIISAGADQSWWYNILSSNSKYSSTNGSEVLLAKFASANMNTTGDVGTASVPAGKYIVTKIIFTNASANLSTDTGYLTVWTGAEATGDNLNDTVDSATNLTAPEKFQEASLSGAAPDTALTATTLYLNRSNAAFGSAATLDVYVFGKYLP